MASYEPWYAPIRPKQNLRPSLPPMPNLSSLSEFPPLPSRQNQRPSRQNQRPSSSSSPPLPPMQNLMNIPVPVPVPVDASIADFVDKKVILILLDDRKLIGTMISFDQHCNIVLEGATERKIFGDLYCDIPIGSYKIRGDNLALIGEMDSQIAELPPQMTRVSLEQIQRAVKVEKESLDIKRSMRTIMSFLDSD